MDFSLCDDQIALRDAVQRFCDGEYPVHERGQPEDPARAAQRHAAMASLGLLGLPFDPAFGGSGQGPVEAMLVAQELGRALAGGEWLAQVPLAGQLIAEAASAAQQDRWLPALAAGTLRAALACEEPGGRWDPARIESRARAEADGWRLDGHKHGVLAGDSATLLLVVARGPAGPSLFAVLADAPGLDHRPYRTLDGRGAAHLVLQDVPAEPVGAPGGALPFVQRALDRANAMLCAEAAGAAEALLALTTEHLRTRRQFGQPLARFQALQHRIADRAIALEQLKSMACVAALSLEAPDEATRGRGVSAAKALAAQLGRQAALEAIQMHGAMGMTDECAASRYARRLLALGALFGDAGFHLRRFASLRPDDNPGDTP